MSKVAFIGDSFTAYRQDGQYKNSWSWKLAQKFPQHEYLNYGRGGHGNNYYRWCLLDAKLREVDIVFISRTYNHRVGLFINDYEFEFVEKIISDNYTTLEIDNDRYVWYSPTINTWSLSKKEISRWAEDRDLSLDQANQIGNVMQLESVSMTCQTYNDKWFDNVTNLYNFKHIIPLELMSIPQEGVINERMNSCVYNNAFNLMAQAHGVKNCHDDTEMFMAGLTVSETDSHLSPYGNDWVLENFILTQDTVDILINSSKENYYGKKNRHK